MYCWGYNFFGQLGDNSTTQRLVPTAVSGGGFWKQLSAGSYHTCGIKADDSIYCWGRNGNGQLGDNSTTQRLSPTTISGGGAWKQISVGNNHTCGIKSDDSAWCWGSNANGQLGDNSTTQQLVPTAVSGGGTWKQVSAAGSSFSSHTCGIKSDDTLYCWGSNTNGQLGDNSTTQRLVPTAISGGGAWKQVSTAGGLFTSQTCGIKSDDTLYCWGNNSNGQLGDNSTTQRLVPTAISGGGAWKLVEAGNNHTCGIKSDDSFYCWGLNTNGQLGDNSTTQRLVPTAVSGGGTWMDAAAGNTHSCAITILGALTCWGDNYYGQLTATDFSGPAFRVTGESPICSDPIGKAGALVYNSTSSVMQYCDGVGWVGIGK